MPLFKYLNKKIIRLYNILQYNLNKIENLMFLGSDMFRIIFLRTKSQVCVVMEKQVNDLCYVYILK